VYYMPPFRLDYTSVLAVMGVWLLLTHRISYDL
jgi:hypothetical protein